jgi:5-methylthioribose kinase
MENRVFDLKHKEEVVKYIREKGYASEPFLVVDISSGNMNYVYRAKEVTSGKTYILKYAATHTRISEHILVSTERIKIEARVLMVFNQQVPEYVPHIYQYDDHNKCIIMKDYSEYGILRDRLLQCEIIPDFTDNITSYLVRSIMPTLNIDENKEVEGSDLKRMQNPLCETTKTYVFSEPLIRTGNSNDIFKLSQKFIESEVYQDDELIKQVNDLKEQFTNKRQALLHGDLHTGSIFVHKSSIIVFDYEFAFYGPIGFDIGNLLANLVFSWLHAKAIGQKQEFMYWMEATIQMMIDGLKKGFVSEFELRYNTDAHYTSEYITAYVEDIIHDVAAFAGVELLRRVIGIAHVNDIISISNPEKRAEAEQIAIKLAKKFITDRSQFNCGADFAKDVIVFS